MPHCLESCLHKRRKKLLGFNTDWTISCSCISRSWQYNALTLTVTERRKQIRIAGAYQVDQLPLSRTTSTRILLVSARQSRSENTHLVDSQSLELPNNPIPPLPLAHLLTLALSFISLMFDLDILSFTQTTHIQILLTIKSGCFYTQPLFVGKVE